MKIVVLGAGVVGVASAWYLSRAGHEVTVIDRQGAAAQETSFANGGQIAVSHAEPWANPATPRKIWQWLGQEDAPLLLRLRADPALWRWSWRFLLECRARRTRANIRPITTLAQYSRSCLQALRAELAPQGGLHYDQLQRGILHLYTDAKEFEQALHAADIMRDYGCDRRPLTADECVAIEPALASNRPVAASSGLSTAAIASAPMENPSLFSRFISEIFSSSGQPASVTPKGLLRKGALLAGAPLGAFARRPVEQESRPCSWHQMQ